MLHRRCSKYNCRWAHKKVKNDYSFIRKNSSLKETQLTAIIIFSYFNLFSWFAGLVLGLNDSFSVHNIWARSSGYYYFLNNFFQKIILKLMWNFKFDLSLMPGHIWRQFCPIIKEQCIFRSSFSSKLNHHDIIFKWCI